MEKWSCSTKRRRPFSAAEVPFRENRWNAEISRACWILDLQLRHVMLASGEISEGHNSWKRAVVGKKKNESYEQERAKTALQVFKVVLNITGLKACQKKCQKWKCRARPKWMKSSCYRARQPSWLPSIKVTLHLFTGFLPPTRLTFSFLLSAARRKGRVDAVQRNQSFRRHGNLVRGRI